MKWLIFTLATGGGILIAFGNMWGLIGVIPAIVESVYYDFFKN